MTLVKDKGFPVDDKRNSPGGSVARTCGVIAGGRSESIRAVCIKRMTSGEVEWRRFCLEDSDDEKGWF